MVQKKLFFSGYNSFFLVKPERLGKGRLRKSDPSVTGVTEIDASDQKK